MSAVPSVEPSSTTMISAGAIDWVRNKTEASAILLASAGDGKVTLIAGMSKAVVGKGVKAGDLIKEIEEEPTAISMQKYGEWMQKYGDRLASQ